VPDADSTTAIEAVYRIEFPRVVAALAAFTGGIGLAEEFAQDALVEALRQWPSDGTPQNPAAWLTTVGKRKAIDAFRRDRTLAVKYAQIGRELQVHSAAGDESALRQVSNEEIDDDRLRLIFVACHPVLAMPARTALTLRLVGGLTVPEIARAYVVPEATIAQRIVRAKRAIARAGVPFELPVGEDRLARLGGVLEVIYLVFNEGYSATSGEDWIRPELCGEALRLGRVLAALMPDEPEVLGLLALLLFHESRAAARFDGWGRLIRLEDQDRRRWDAGLASEATGLLDRAIALRRPGPYQIQAAIAALHSAAPDYSTTDWRQIRLLYGRLQIMTPSPVVLLNLAVATRFAVGPEAALTELEAIAADLDDYRLFHAVRAELLAAVGRTADARDANERALALTANPAERELLTRRLTPSTPPGD
jgi:RNA polymerase sigma factor (sigma-70 family)